MPNMLFVRVFTLDRSRAAPLPPGSSRTQSWCSKMSDASKMSPRPLDLSHCCSWTASFFLSLYLYTWSKVCGGVWGCVKRAERHRPSNGTETGFNRGGRRICPHARQERALSRSAPFSCSHSGFCRSSAECRVQPSYQLSGFGLTSK